MRAVVAGYQTIGCLGLEALRRHGFDVRAVLTHRDDPREEIWWRSLADEARVAGVPVHDPDDLNDPAVRARVAAYEPEFLFSFYYRRLIPGSILSLATRGAFNLHGSLLPKFRGRAPVNWALIHGETETGVSLHQMIEQPDAGPLVDQEKIPIAFEDTAFTLYLKLFDAAVRLLDRTLPALRKGEARSTPIDPAAGSCYGRRRPEDGRIDWSQSAQQIYNLVRAVTHPYPGAFTRFRNRRLLVWWASPAGPADARPPGTVIDAGPEGITVATGAGALRLLTVQLEGAPETPACSLAASGRAPAAGEILGR